MIRKIKSWFYQLFFYIMIKLTQMCLPDLTSPARSAASAAGWQSDVVGAKWEVTLFK
jgi:hypothetical protein